MAFYDTVWYCNAGDQAATGYYAVPKRPQNAAVAAGAIRRQFTAPAVGNERCFVCIVAGTTANVADATWVLTRGAKTTDGTVTWQECTGASAVNGDAANTPTWAVAKVLGTPTLGAIIKRNSGASYQICTTAGTMAASEPAFSDTAGVTTADGTTTWTSLGPVANFPGGGAPHARLANATTSGWWLAGHTVYVGDDHAESQATAITISPVGSLTTVGKILCHKHSGSYPPAAGDLTSGATISTSAAVNITWSPGAATLMYVNGLTLKAGVGSASVANILLTPSGNGIHTFDNCSFWLENTGSGLIQLGNTASGAHTLVWNNCTMKFGAVGQRAAFADGMFTWQNTGQVLESGSVVPTNLFGIGDAALATTPEILLEALDLSQITGNLIVYNFTGSQGSLSVNDCKLTAAMAVVTPAVPGMTFQFARCDS